MSILETITSLNQEASAARASTEMSNAKTSERISKKLPSQPSTETTVEKERTSEDTADKEKSTPDSAGEGQETVPKSEEFSDRSLILSAQSHPERNTQSPLPFALNCCTILDYSPAKVAPFPNTKCSLTCSYFGM